MMKRIIGIGLIMLIFFTLGCIQSEEDINGNNIQEFCDLTYGEFKEYFTLSGICGYIENNSLNETKYVLINKTWTQDKR